MFIEHLLFSWSVSGGKMDKKMNEGCHQDGVIEYSRISLLPGHTTSSLPTERNTDDLRDSYMLSAWENTKLKWVGKTSLKSTPSTVPYNQEGTFDLPASPWRARSLDHS